MSDKRIETWRSAGFTTVVSAPKGGFLPGQAAVSILGENARATGCEIAGGDSCVIAGSGGFGSGFRYSRHGQ